MEHNYSKFGLVCQFDHILIILWYVICLTKKAELTQPIDTERVLDKHI